MSNLNESRSSLGLYLGALIILALSCLCYILIITSMRPDKDNTQLNITGVGLITPIILCLVNAINGHRAGNAAEEAKKVAVETKLIVNGRMDQQLADAKEAAYQKGIAETEAKYRLMMTAPPVQVAVPVPVAVAVDQTKSNELYRQGSPLPGSAG